MWYADRLNFAVAHRIRCLLSFGEGALPVAMTRRRRLFIAVVLLGLVPLVAGFVFFARGSQVEANSLLIKQGMSRSEVEQIMGPPYLKLNRQGGKGTLLVWTDDFWQVDVRFDSDDRAESLARVPANSWYRRTATRLGSFFK